MSEDFKYLGNNPGTQNVPFLDNLNIQKTVTSFNYSAWGALTKIYLKHVPASWSNDYQNVVQFESKAERDSYFKTDPPITLETEFRIPHDGVIKLPIPYDNLINFNYLMAEYPDAPVPDYQPNLARKQYFYFIKDCKYIAGNTTLVTLELDVWTSYIDDIEIANMQLERGHYPMTLTDVDSYLANPLLNRIGLDTMDVSFGDLCKIPTDHQYNLYGDVFYLVATTSDPTSFTKETTTYNGSTGKDKWNKGLYYFSVAESNWTTWVVNTMNNTPAFFQTIKGLLVMPMTLFNTGAPSFTFNGVTCYAGLDSAFSINYTFTKADFGYSSNYQWLTKLYTSPYAVVELLDFNGNKQQIPFEDLYVGKFAMQLFFNLAIANPTARAIVMNIGGNGNAGEFNQVGIDIPVPTMSVNLSPNKKYMFETEYPRAQEQASIGNSYTNSILSAQTGKTIGDANANLSSTIAKRGNDQSKDFTTHDLDTSETILDNNVDQNKRMSYANMLTQQYSAWNNLNNENTSFAAKGAGTIAAMTNTVAMGALSASAGNPMAVPAIATGVVNQSYNFLTAETMLDVVSQMIEVNLNQSLGIQRSISGLNEDHTFTVESVDKTISVALTAENGLINNKAQENFDTNKTNTEYKRDQSYTVAESNRTDSLSRGLANNSLSYNTSAQIAAANKALGEAGIQRAI